MDGKYISLWFYYKFQGVNVYKSLKVVFELLGASHKESQYTEG